MLYLSTAEPHISSLSLLTPFRQSHSLCSPSLHGCWYTVSFCTDREGQEHGVTYCSEHLCMHIKHILWTQNTVKPNSHSPYNDISFNDGSFPQHYNTILLQLPTAFSTVTCCTGLLPWSNRLYHIDYLCSRLYYLGLCEYTLWSLHNDAFIQKHPVVKRRISVQCQFTHVISLTECNSGTIRKLCVWEMGNGKCICKYVWTKIFAIGVMNLCCAARLLQLTFVCLSCV